MNKKILLLRMVLAFVCGVALYYFVTDPARGVAAMLTIFCGAVFVGYLSEVCR